MVLCNDPPLPGKKYFLAGAGKFVEKFPLENRTRITCPHQKRGVSDFENRTRSPVTFRVQKTAAFEVQTAKCERVIPYYLFTDH